MDEADVNDNLAFNQNSHKRAGDNNYMNQKNKRKRSESPPPSRRAVGLPNTPPPKTEYMTRPPLEPIKQALQDLKKSIGVNGNNINNKKDNEKKHSHVNQQLRKLQEMRRNKKNQL